MTKAGWINRLLLTLAVAAWTLPASAGELHRYAEGSHGQGQLRYINGIPVLTVRGTPEQVGEQIAVLALRDARQLHRYPRDMLHAFRADFAYPVFVRAGKSLLPHFPESYRRELEAMASQGIDRDMLIVSNTMFDISKLFACSSLIVNPSRSRTGEPIFGRNLDFPTLGYLQRYSLLTVYHPQGKHAFASIEFPGLIGCLSGMNDAGLTLAILEVLDSKDKSPKFNWKGTPYALNYRRILEECTTVAEAEALLRTMKRTTRNNLAVCDQRGGVVFEITPQTIAVRRSANGCCPCTNHFCTAELAPARVPNRVGTLNRFQALVQSVADRRRIGLPEVARALHAANGGDFTLQTMIFEPASYRLHLAIGDCPTSALPMRTIELRNLLGVDRHEEANRQSSPTRE